MYCKRCGTPLHTGVVICPECGARQRRQASSVRCATCHSRVPLTLAVCPHCGREPEAFIIKPRMDYPTWQEWPRLYEIRCEDCGKAATSAIIHDEISIRFCLVQIWCKLTLPLSRVYHKYRTRIKYGRLFARRQKTPSGGC